MLSSFKFLVFPLFLGENIFPLPSQPLPRPLSQTSQIALKELFAMYFFWSVEGEGEMPKICPSAARDRGIVTPNATTGSDN